MVERTSKRALIVNVDDFGISDGVNRAVIDGHSAGVITSASLMVNTVATDNAVELARSHPKLSMGIHVNFTNEGDPPVVSLDDTTACRDELDRQLERFERLVGRPPSHIDSHHHVHRRESLEPLFVDVANRLGLPLREESAVRWFGSFYAAWDDETHPEQVTFDSLAAMLQAFDDEVTELSTHVGYVDPDFESEYHAERELELATILDPRLPRLITSLGFELISYDELRDWIEHVPEGPA